MIKEWKKISTKIITKNKIFMLRENSCLSPKDGKKYPFLLLDTQDWVNIIPITEDNEVILIKQFRHGSEAITLEIPGGMTDMEDKNPRKSAIRELVEETGYVGNDVIKLGECSPNPAIFNNKLHIYLAKNVEKKYSQNLEGTEDIEIVKMHINEISDLIKTGKINHALVIAAFYYYFNTYK